VSVAVALLLGFCVAGWACVHWVCEAGFSGFSGDGSVCVGVCRSIAKADKTIDSREERKSASKNYV